MTAPNIVLIIFDDMTFEQLQRMPQLMKLAKTGTSFMNAYANTALCQPSRTTLLTGQYTHNHGILDNAAYSTAAFNYPTMLPKCLQLAGYKTCHVGKFNNTLTVADAIPAGWDEWHTISPQTYFSYSINDNGATTVTGTASRDYNTNVVRDRAVSFIGSATQPFFMQVSFKAPHWDGAILTAVPAAEYAGCMGSKTAPRNPNFNVKMGTPPNYMAHAAMDGGTISSVDSFWRGQSEMLFSADRALQAIAAAIASSGKTNTIIIITSDHGYYHGEGMNPSEKIAPYVPAIHIPLVVSGPSQFVAQDKTCTQIVSHIDITATIFALSSATPTRTLDGVSLAPVLLNPTGSAALRNYLLLEFLGSGSTGWGAAVPVCRSVLTKQYLYTLYATAEDELFDLRADPFQLTNQANSAAYSAVKTDLASRLSGATSCSGASCVI